jgi:hypothetical protein
MIKISVRNNIVVYQDSEFTWFNSPSSPATRIINHNRGRVAENIQVHVFYTSNWMLANKVYLQPSNQGYGWTGGYDGTPNLDKNRVAIGLWGNLTLTNSPCRVRLYWYNDTDIEDSSSGYLVG